MAPANETLTANPAMNVPITENLTVFNNTTLKPVGEDNEDMLNVVLVPVLIMALMISIAAIVTQFFCSFSYPGFSYSFPHLLDILCRSETKCSPAATSVCSYVLC